MTGLDPYRGAPDTQFDAWNFRTDVAVELGGAQLAGHKVEAIDGNVGKVVDTSVAPGDSYLIISTGRLFGRRTMLPAGTVNHIDHSEQKIYIDRSRSEVKAAPEITAADYGDPLLRENVASYYRAAHG